MRVENKPKSRGLKMENHKEIAYGWYFVETSNGPLKNDHDQIAVFGSSCDARQAAINYCDLSDKKLRVVGV